MSWVIDCSFFAALFLPDEKSEIVSSFFKDLSKNDTIIVPNLWWYEISNVLSVSVKRNRLSHKDTKNILNLFNNFEIITDKKSGPEYSADIFDLSQLYMLSAYDAAYLELSLRKEASLASLDNKLIKAAEKAGLKYFK